jgi:hypothetical protein
MYVPKHFTLQEFLPEDFYKKVFPIYGERLWSIFDVRVLSVCDQLRDIYGPIVMNTWHSQKMREKYGRHQWRGYRDPTSPYVYSTNSVYGNISQHRFGRAADLVFLRTNAEQVRKDILANPFKKEFHFINAIEDKVPWLHFDVRNHTKGKYGVKVFSKT